MITTYQVEVSVTISRHHPDEGWVPQPADSAPELVRALAEQAAAAAAGVLSTMGAVSVATELELPDSVKR